MPKLTMYDPDALTGHEIEITDDRCARLRVGRGIAWRSPEVPDITVHEGGMIIEHEDARPLAGAGTPQA